MFLIFENNDIINLDNVAIIEADDHSDDEVAISIATTAITYHPGDGFLTPEQVNNLRRRYVIKKKKWLGLLDAIDQGRGTFFCY